MTSMTRPAAPLPVRDSVRGSTSAAWGLADIYSVAVFLFFFGALHIAFRGVTEGSENLEGGAGPVFLALAATLQATGLLVVALRRPALLFVFTKQPVLFALLGLAILSSSWSIGRTDTIVRSMALAGTTISALSVLSLLSRERLLRALNTTFLLACLASLVLAIVMPSIGVHNDQHSGAWRGIFTHKNTLGWASALASLSLLSYVLRRSFRADVWAGGLIVALVCLVASRSATAYLGFAFGLLAYMALVVATWSGKWRVPLLLGSVLVVGVLFLFRDAILLVVLEAVDRNPSLTGRTIIWDALLPFIWERPWGGYGYQAFWDSELALYATELIFFAGHAHNGYIDLTLQLGLAGLAAYAALIILTLTTLYKRAIGGDYFARILFVLVCVISLIGISGPVILRHNTLYWQVVTIAALYPYLYKRQMIVARKSPALPTLHGLVP